MEVVDKIVEPKEETKKEPTWTEQLTEGIKKADTIAHQIKEKVLLPQFTLVKMAELMRISREEAQQKISFIGKMGYIEEKKQGGVMFFRVVTDAKERIKNIEQAVQSETASFKMKLEYFEAMKEITNGYITD